MTNKLQNNPDPTELLKTLDAMIEAQNAKCLRIARRIVPHLTADDVMNPFDWPEVASHPQFAWEDGLLAGLQSAHAALSARIVELESNKSSAKE